MIFKKTIRLPFRENFSPEYDKRLNSSKVLDMENYLHHLQATEPGSFNPGLIKRIKKRIKAKSDRELFVHVNREHAGFWSLRPSFYHALLDELRLRKLLK